MKTIYSILIILFCYITPVKAPWGWTNINSAWLQIGPNDNPGPNLLASNSFTMSVWFTRTVDRGTTRAVIISKGQTHPNPLADSICYDFAILTNRLRFRYSPPGGGVVHTWQATTAAPNTNVLTHAVVKYTFGSATSIVMFVNGTNYTGSWVEGDGTVQGTNHNKSMLFGQDGFGTPLMGIISDFAIWNSMLDDNEILRLYNNKLKHYPLMVSQGTLFGYWPLDGWPELRQATTDIIPYYLNLKRRESYGSQATFGSFVSFNERRFSYYPNE